MLDPGDQPIPNVYLTLSDGSATFRTRTGRDGQYAFAQVPAGTWTLTETQPANFEGTDASVGSGGGVAGINSVSDIVLIGDEVVTDYNFYETSSARVSGRVYVDDDGSQTFTPGAGDTALEGITVTLRGFSDLGGSVSQTTTTAASGVYTLETPEAGVYTITLISAAPGFAFVYAIAGNRGGSAGVSRTTAISLSLAQPGMGYDFVAQPPGLSGYIYNDVNGDALPDVTNDEVNAGWTVALTRPDGGTDTTSTNANGFYRFGLTTPGVYTVTRTDPSNYGPPARPHVGTLSGVVVSNTRMGGIVFAAGAAGVNYNFPACTCEHLR